MGEVMQTRDDSKHNNLVHFWCVCWFRHNMFTGGIHNACCHGWRMSTLVNIGACSDSRKVMLANVACLLS